MSNSLIKALRFFFNYQQTDEKQTINTYNISCILRGIANANDGYYLV